MRSGNCINTYFDYENVLQKKRSYYEKEYGLVPEFKAGLDSGSITVAEVGEVKKELAYHGDVLNTASRIQGKCNEFKSKILISEGLKHQLEAQPSSKGFELIGSLELKGKENPVRIFKIANN